ncbi:MAG: GGDEF domain-containing protein [Oscillospiraceae bacterium]|jgi:diguanylate cyclase (GGDEF)-like protein|nr:GGDEF domain-containing protein [Oscillospiraceae bacterium]
MKKINKKNKLQNLSVIIIAVFLLATLAVVAFMTLKNTSDLNDILKESIKSQLISISYAAREIIDVDRFNSYNSVEDTEKDGLNYGKTLAALRRLQTEVGAEYIYALKQLNGKYYFVFDTDVEDPEIFIEYELSPVHEHAFVGKDSADVLNVTDDYGSYNTGAVPIWKNGKVIGIISTDLEDEFMSQSSGAARGNAIFLFAAIVVTMGLMMTVLLILVKRVNSMQEKMHHMANYDVITGLPNRQCLLEYLGDISSKVVKTNEPFALFFVDLDNFKSVNDGAGHDAGDELLRHIAAYLDNFHDNVKAFRPPPGILNISARIGGDEFVQVVPGISDATEASIVAQKMLDNFSSQAIDRYIEKYKVGLSIGVALFPYHSNDYNVLIKYADIAMYHAKRAGKHGYCVYSDEMFSEVAL